MVMSVVVVTNCLLQEADLFDEGSNLWSAKEKSAVVSDGVGGYLLKINEKSL